MFSHCTFHINHTSWLVAVAQTDRPKSVCNRCVIKVFGGVLCVVTLLFGFSVSVRAFVTGLRQISSFFSDHESLIHKEDSLKSLPLRLKTTARAWSCYDAYRYIVPLIFLYVSFFLHVCLLYFTFLFVSSSSCSFGLLTCTLDCSRVIL